MSSASSFCIVTDWRIRSLARHFADPGTFMSKTRRFAMAQWDVFSSQLGRKFSGRIF
jgi:hypothetical protein